MNEEGGALKKRKGFVRTSAVAGPRVVGTFHNQAAGFYVAVLENGNAYYVPDIQPTGDPWKWRLYAEIIKT